MPAFVDLTGQTFGDLAVIERHGSSSNGDATWLCRCTCGAETVVLSSNLRRGRSRSCGHGTNKLKNFVGERFDTHTVIKRVEDDPRYGPAWLLRCSCGEEKVITSKHLHVIRGTATQLKCSCRPTLAALPKGHAAFNGLYNKWRYRAQQRRPVPFELSKQEVWELIQQPCHYCGVEPYHTWPPDGHTNGRIVYQGLDRVDNDRGYVSGNVVPCCGTCNKAKLAMSQSAFKDWVCRVHQHWAGKGCE